MVIADRTEKEIQRKLFIEMTSTDKSPEENQENIEFFKTLGKTNSVVDMQIISNYLLEKPDNLEKLKDIFSQIQDTKGKLTVDVNKNDRNSTRSNEGVKRKYTVLQFIATSTTKNLYDWFFGFIYFC